MKVFKKFVIGALAVFFILLLLQAIVVTTQKIKAENAAVSRNNAECLTEERVFDYGNVLSDKEEEKLRKLIAEKEKEIRADIVILTLNEAGHGDMMEYADDFYDTNKFGWNKPNGDGAIFADNWYDNYCWFSTSGRVEEKYTDEMIDFLLDKTCYYVNANPYYAYKTYVETLARDMVSSNVFSSFQPKLTWGAVAGMAALLFFLFNIISQGARKTVNRGTYTKSGKSNIKKKEDIFLKKSVSKRKIDTGSSHSGGSSGRSGGHHISGSGRSHGGGGRRH